MILIFSVYFRKIFRDNKIMEGRYFKMIVQKYMLIPNDRRAVTFEGKEIVLYRTQALVDIPAYGIKAGDLGGYIPSEKHWSHKGNSWFGKNCLLISGLVYGDVFVSGNVILEDSYISGEAKVVGNVKLVRTQVYDKALISGMTKGCHIEVTDSHISGQARVISNGTVRILHSTVYGQTRVQGLYEGGQLLIQSCWLGRGVYTDDGYNNKGKTFYRVIIPRP